MASADLAPSLQRLRQRDLIGILEIATDRQAALTRLEAREQLADL